LAISTASSRQRKNIIFEIKVFNQFHFDQALCNLFGLFVLCLKGVYQSQSNEVRQFHLNGHGATIGCTKIAHARFVARPSFRSVYVYDAGRRSHEDSLFNLKVAIIIQ